jgi:Fe2+ or Zn2+ uptake regulation protein
VAWLRAAGLRVTPPRLAVLAAVRQFDHPDVDCVVGHAPCLESVGDAGFLVDEADVTFWGFCPACKDAG